MVRLVALREDMDDRMEEAAGLIFALQCLANQAGREADAAVVKAAGSIPLDQPLVALSHIASKFACESSAR